MSAWKSVCTAMRKLRLLVPQPRYWASTQGPGQTRREVSNMAISGRNRSPERVHPCTCPVPVQRYLLPQRGAELEPCASYIVPYRYEESPQEHLALPTDRVNHLSTDHHIIDCTSNITASAIYLKLMRMAIITVDYPSRRLKHHNAQATSHHIL